MNNCGVPDGICLNSIAVRRHFDYNLFFNLVESPIKKFLLPYGAFAYLTGLNCIIAPPTKPCRQMLDIKKISLRQKNLKCESIPAFSFLDKFPFCLRLFGKV